MSSSPLLEHVAGALAARATVFILVWRNSNARGDESVDVAARERLFAERYTAT